MSPLPWFKVATACFSIFLISRLRKFTLGLKAVDYLPGMRVPFAPMSLFGAVIPTTWWNPGLNWFWKWRKTAYMSHTHDIISIVPFILGEPVYFTGSLGVMNQLLENERKLQLEKPREMFLSLELWGHNIVSANGEMWKRHRRILTPAFTQKTYSLVLNETISTYHEMLRAEGWRQQKEFVVKDFNRIPLKLALIMISRCGFRLPMPWDDSGSEKDASHGKALAIVSTTSILRLITPGFMYKLPIPWVQQIDHTWTSFAEFMHNLVNTCSEELNLSTLKMKNFSGDLFTQLIATWDEYASVGLNEQEVIGNSFALMFAGHETTAHVMSALLGYLAIHQNEQEKVYQEIQSVLVGGRDPTLDDLRALDYTLACFYESVRMFPAGPLLPRDLQEDVIIKVNYPEERNICLKKGSRIIVDMVGVHHDPHIFPDPEKFIPSRWFCAPEHAILMFGIGPRACIGRKFAVTEALAFLAMLLREWKFDVCLKDGESREEYEESVMTQAGMIGLAFGVHSIDLKVIARV